MINILLILAVIGGTIFALTRYFLEKQKKAVLEDIYKEYFSILDKFSTLPGELKEILVETYKQVRISIREIELKYENYKKSSDVFDFVDLKKAQKKEIERQITENKKKWLVFDKFMKDVGYIKLNIENLQKDIKRRNENIMLSFAEKNSEQEEKDNFIQEETDKIIAELDIVYREYDKLQGDNFLSFDTQKVLDTEKMKLMAVEDGEAYFSLLNHFNKEIEIKIIGISRRSTFYIKLKELLEGYKSGKNKMANLGEVPVVFKNFEKLEEGSRYRQDVFVSSKRVVQEIEAEFKVISGEDEFTHIVKLNYDELLDLLNLSDIRPRDEENDENNIAYNFEITDFEISVAKKEKQELFMQYARDLDILIKIPIKK